MNDTDARLNNLIDLYIELEKKIKNLVHPFNRQFCAPCAEKCCKEEYCRESIDSPFLLKLIAKQGISYDKQKGWLSPSGCRLAYGRPLVCYDFFCDAISNSNDFKTSKIQAVIKEFVATGNRARGNTHLICIENIEGSRSTATAPWTWP